MGHKHIKRDDTKDLLTTEQYEAFLVKKSYLDKLSKTDPELHKTYIKLRKDSRKILGLANRADWKVVNKDKNDMAIRRCHFRKKYGITLEYYNDMLVKQGGVCAICGNPETALGTGGNVAMLSVDHCHTTGNVRKLLCKRCNTMLGLSGESVSVLNNAIQYLEDHKNADI